MKDRQPKHRQLAKERNKIERKTAIRRETGSALVVCEGKCTEPFYLQGVLQHLRLSSANVEIIRGQSDSNAVAVVERALRRFTQRPCDRVFVVIDAEQKDLAQALALCKTPVQNENEKKGLSGIFIVAIVSTPCFVFWLLIHFRYCARPFSRFSEVLSELKKHLPGYEKIDPHIFVKVDGAVGLQRALQHAERLRTEHAKIGSRNPGTDMDVLIHALMGLKL
jgi:hypothetical protein